MNSHVCILVALSKCTFIFFFCSFGGENGGGVFLRGRWEICIADEFCGVGDLRRGE